MLLGISLAVLYATVIHGFFDNESAFAAPVTGLSFPAVTSAVSQQSDPAVLTTIASNKTLRSETVVTPQEQREVARFNALMASPTPTATEPAQEDAVVRAATVVETPVLPPYQTYVVQEGDTVSAIAARFGVSSDYVVWNNPEIEDSDFLHLGQSIIIPAGDGILHEVRYGETLSDIAGRFSVTVDDITAFAGNNIATADDIRERQLVFVPNAQPLPAVSAEPAEPTAEPTDAPAPAAPDTPVPVNNSGGNGGGAPAAPVVSAAPSSTGLIWPVYGPISSYYGPGHPLGIDIDGYNLAGAAIGAATSGTVMFAGGNACCSYGLYVVVMSPGGIETLYGHLSSISVVAGQTVAQGQTLGIIGSTGYSTGRHLHFEVIDNGVRQNPLSYLP